MTVILKAMFSRRYWLLTVIVCVAVAVCIRAGFWQMDRREQKRQLNQMLVERWDAPPFDLTHDVLPADLGELEYRRIQVEGKFDYTHQIVLKNDTRDGVPGVNLITPLVMPDGRAILVARGWVPLGDAAREAWPQLEEKTGQPVVGLIKESQTLPGAATPTAPQTEWFRVDVAAIQRQVPYPLLPAFLAMLSEPGRAVDALPARTPPPELADEYMHVSYTIQWFTFAAVFAFGYVQYIILHERRRRRQLEGVATEAQQAASDLPTLPHQV
jgi:surfeit locus 1 family protein